MSARGEEDPSREGAGRRDDWLRLDDEALASQCLLTRTRGSGPGGQRRNKVETGVRLRHEPSGVEARAEESRSSRTNRARALRRLRERIALEVRRPFDLLDPVVPPEVLERTAAGARLRVNPRNPAWPLVAATALDALRAAGGRFAPAASALDVTTSQFVRFLRASPRLWQVASRMRSR